MLNLVLSEEFFYSSARELSFVICHNDPPEAADNTSPNEVDLVLRDGC